MNSKRGNILWTYIPVLILVGLAILRLAYCTLMPLRMIDVDRTWEYGMAKYMAEGSRLYADINICVPPLYYDLISALLRIHDSYNFFCILELCVNVCMVICMYAITRALQVGRKNSVIISSIVTIMTPWDQFSGYNAFVMLFALISLALLVRTTMDRVVSDARAFVIGAVSFLALISKHSNGLFVVVSALLSVLWLQWTYTGNYKKVCRALLCFSTGGFIVVLACIGRLLMQDVLDDCIDMVFLGVSSFQVGLSQCIVAAFSIGLAAISIFIYARRHCIKDKPWIIVSLIYMVLMLNNMFPLPNLSHVILPTVFIWLFYFIIMAQILQTGRSVQTVLKELRPCGVGLFLSILIVFFSWVVSGDDSGKVQIYIDKQQCDEVWDTISQDSEHKYLFIHQYSAYLHYTHGEGFEKYYDLFADGNLGTAVPLELVQNADCDYFIITDDLKWTFWQYDDAAMDYIRSLNKVTTIGTYEDGEPVFAVYRQNKAM